MAVPVKPEMLQWALDRAGKKPAALPKSLAKKLPDCLNGDKQLTLNQLREFANATFTAIGYFFLPQPPQINLPIPDFRTIGDDGVANPTPHLIEMVHRCQRRQAWYRDYLLQHNGKVLPFVNSKSIADDVETVAAEICNHFGIDVANRRNKQPEDSFRDLRKLLEAKDLLVMVSGTVDFSNNRRLEVEEFRGFALVDDYAPLIFVNGRDSKTAQAFTVFHELAHIYLGQTGLSDVRVDRGSEIDHEAWCNRVAAAVLVPMKDLKAMVSQPFDWYSQKDVLRSHFVVSSQVLLLRLRDLGYFSHLSEAEFWKMFRMEARNANQQPNKESSGGPKPFVMQTSKMGKKFTQAVVFSAREGRVNYGDAASLLGRKTVSMIDTFYHELKGG